jgi:HD-like signal output (HDOD) protein/CheY-like chemotaxis protein
MKRILFVDDETLVLEGIQRMFRPMRNEWEMAFAAGGAEALEIMSKQPFDVVVSDMRMPGMSGVELLNEVMKRQPQTVRLILSGHSDKDLILKCVGTTHQYLSKPCEAEALKAAIQRSSALVRSVHSDKLKRLVGRMDHIPSLPSLYVEIVDQLKDPESQLDDISQIIARDIGMTAQILKLVNSAYFGLPQRISGLEDAVAFLGLETIKTLVLCINAFSQYNGIKLPGFTMESLWKHSLAVASLAKKISRIEGMDRNQIEESFVAGMLHDTGLLILACNFTAEYKLALEFAAMEKLTVDEAEQRVFGVNHAIAGGYLLGLWGLPVPLVEAIALHHKPEEATDTSFSPLSAVHFADSLIQSDDGPLTQGAAPARLNLDYLAKLGLADRLKTWEKAIHTNDIDDL